MDAGRLVIVGGGTLLGVWLLSRLASASVPSSSTAPASSTTQGLVNPTFTDFGPVVPQLGPAYAALKPIADNITTPLINGLNHAVGGADPYGGVKNLKQNPDGTFTGTDGLGATVTFNKDGTINRSYGSFSQQWERSNVHGALVDVKNAAVSGYEGAKSAVSSAYHTITGLF